MKRPIIEISTADSCMEYPREGDAIGPFIEGQVVKKYPDSPLHVVLEDAEEDVAGLVG